MAPKKTYYTFGYEPVSFNLIYFNSYTRTSVPTWDSTGAKSIIVAMAFFAPRIASSSDLFGNTYTLLTKTTQGNVAVQIAYINNPITNSLYQVDLLRSSGAAGFACYGVIALDRTIVFESETNASSASATSVAAPAVTASSIMIAGMCTTAATSATTAATLTDLGSFPFASGLNMGGAFGYSDTNFGPHIFNCNPSAEIAVNATSFSIG